MTTGPRVDYSSLDIPEVIERLFHPRPQYGESKFMQRQGKPPEDLLIPVEEGVVVGCRVHIAGPGDPNILFFHGNGEIASDYDDLGPIYAGMGMNFFAADYRGYGRSTGSPTVSSMMADCPVVFRLVKDWLKENGHTGRFIVMGRSLGSASALELVACCGDEIDGLIVDSGFAYLTPLLEILGVNLAAGGFDEVEGTANIDKIRSFAGPTLIIHAELDEIIPFGAGEALYEASPAKDKTFLGIPRAGHNDIFAHALPEYMAEVKLLTERISR